MHSIVKKNVIACVKNAEGAKYPYQVQELVQGQARIKGTDQFVDTTETGTVNSLVEVALGQRLVVIAGGTITERAGNVITKVVEWQRVEGVIPEAATGAQIIAILDKLSKAKSVPAVASTPAHKGNAS
jgi:hypothetical protein